MEDSTQSRTVENDFLDELSHRIKFDVASMHRPFTSLRQRTNEKKLCDEILEDRQQSASTFSQKSSSTCNILDLLRRAVPFLLEERWRLVSYFVEIS